MFIKYKEDETDLIYSFDAKRFLPLSYIDFVDARRGGFKSFKTTCEAESIQIEKNGSVESKQSGRFELPINFHEPLPIYSLVKGGWLPPPFVKPPKLLLDSNAVGNLDAINKGNAQPIYGQVAWWFNFFNEDDLTINPLPYAMEGNQLRTPTLEEIKDSFARASEIIKEKFPSAQIIEYENEHFQTAFELISSISEQNEKDTKFLEMVVPLIKDGVPSERLSNVESEILEFAREIEIDLKSLTVLTVLSCLYDDGRSGFPAARKILKPSSDYTEKLVYNALADLNALRLFIGTLALSESPEYDSFAFCTSDKAIALLWSGFEFSDIKFDKDLGARSTFLLSENLFPRLTEPQRQELAIKLR